MVALFDLATDCTRQKLPFTLRLYSTKHLRDPGFAWLGMVKAVEAPSHPRSYAGMLAKKPTHPVLSEEAGSQRCKLKLLRHDIKYLGYLGFVLDCLMFLFRSQ